MFNEKPSNYFIEKEKKIILNSTEPFKANLFMALILILKHTLPDKDKIFHFISFISD